MENPHTKNNKKRFLKNEGKNKRNVVEKID